MKQKQEAIELGEKIYSDWVEKMRELYCPEMVVDTPRENTLELFGTLHQKNAPAILLQEMCREFARLDDVELFARDGNVYLYSKSPKLYL